MSEIVFHQQLPYCLKPTLRVFQPCKFQFKFMQEQASCLLVLGLLAVGLVFDLLRQTLIVLCNVNVKSLLKLRPVIGRTTDPCLFSLSNTTPVFLFDTAVMVRYRIFSLHTQSCRNDRSCRHFHLHAKCLNKLFCLFRIRCKRCAALLVECNQEYILINDVAYFNSIHASRNLAIVQPLGETNAYVNKSS